MPRKSPFAIRLSREERRVLEQRSRQYTLSYRDVVRAKIVLLAAEGLENTEIGERLDMPRPVVSKWRHRFFRDRLAGLEELPRGGRPSNFSPSGRRARESDCV
jgi:transposase